MSGCSTPACDDVQEKNHQDVLSENKEGDINESENVPEEEDEDEDADFNPFLKESNSVEASSSLSSEVEDLDTDAADSKEKSCMLVDKETVESRGESVKETQMSGNIDHGEEIVPQTADPSREVCCTDVDKDSVLITKSETRIPCEKENEPNSTMDDSIATNSKKLVVDDVDADGAICMRTRARYSLASFTLDELETFLQESDDEDDLQNADDEEEYRKFLAGVLRGDDCQNLLENVNADEEDENDADFELELEEALEMESEPEEVEQRRITRLSRGKKVSKSTSKLHSGKLNRPLRPILPCGPVGSFPPFDGKHLVPNIPPAAYTTPVNNSIPIGFTPHQIGQLHCLIHEHVQLLIQVFALSVLEPVKGNVATEVKKLIGEMLQKRDQVLAWRSAPQPSYCFFPHPSVSNKVQKMIPPRDGNENLHQNMSIFNDMAGSSPNPECTSWMPYVCGPLLSVMDVAPLRLVENFMDDVSSAVRAHERYQIEFGPELSCQKIPLFPIHNFRCSADSDDQGEMESNPSASGGTLHTSPGNQAKKTMAAALLEKAKDRPVALVQKDIAKLAQRFLPLFNPALYPHKPPPPAVANRVLFTNSEDELLALGLLEYNNDWKAIQQRFLPCKSRHQIFVRQKNQSSSKALDNPIKAVRRMKNAPLTSEETILIDVGLKKYKLDWISIWRYFVPYRDPSLLPRQWRIACGTQKSYISDANKKEKRRLNDLRKRVSKPSPPTRRSSSEKEGDSSDDAVDETNHIDKGDEAYVHEAFLADWGPGDSNISSSIPSCMPPSHEGSIRAQTQFKSVAVPSSQIRLRPYRTRRPNNTRLVKLAPDLPPVNLPSSVRIISQSAFRSSQPSTSSNISGPGTLTGPSAKSGSSSNNPVINITANSWPPNQYRVPDFQMHPLLFQAPQDGRLPYYPMNCSTSTPGSFAFFPGNQPQLSLSLFHNPRHIKDAVNFLSKSSKSPEKNLSSSSGVVEFHPLLQRTDDVDTRSGVACPSPVESRPQKHDTLQNRSAFKSRKVNKLDLDIHSSFLSKNQKTSEEVDLTAAARGGIGSESVKDCGRERESNRDETRDELDSDDVPGVLSKNKGSGKFLDAVGDESLPGIVMEQEELSDSEEEFGENVEFEREEMDDSEGDSMSEAEQMELLSDEMNADTHNIRAPNSDNRYGGNLCSTSGGPGIESAGKGVKAKPNNASSFNLNSCPPVSPLSNTENAVGGYDFGPFETVFDRSQKLTASSKVSRLRAKQDTGRVQGSSDTAVPRNKPRKRVCRSKSNLNLAGSENGNANLKTDTSVEKLKDVGTEKFT
ncbi:Homeodomain-like superfamily protein [Striga hermonthica]|uniref:Homeodomain-like superfamily protein n=1 Tax=Striga hermonthica TaxID=68872 RepID=A0A9N7RAC2_STRHE|nr:Homeodomain-like superfamily protein [Striga hermonthica]